MRVLLVGAGGLLGTAVRHAVPQGVDLVSLSKQELDITDRQAVAVTVERLGPEYVINCAGYTAVDQAEREPDLAHRVKRLTEAPGEIVFQPLHYTDVEIRIPNVDKARELLDFEATVDLDDGLARTIAWYRQRKPALA